LIATKIPMGPERSEFDCAVPEKS